jgi:hypothetical protein
MLQGDTIRKEPAAIIDVTGSMTEPVTPGSMLSKAAMVSDPNRADDPEYIVRMVCKVCFVSVETVRLQKVMSDITVPEDWVGLDGLENIFEAEEQKGGVKPDDMPGGSLWED